MCTSFDDSPAVVSENVPTSGRVEGPETPVDRGEYPTFDSLEEEFDYEIPTIDQIIENPELYSTLLQRFTNVWLGLYHSTLMLVIPLVERAIEGRAPAILELLEEQGYDVSEAGLEKLQQTLDTNHWEVHNFELQVDRATGGDLTDLLFAVLLGGGSDE